jgi:hypothetical protein
MTEANDSTAAPDPPRSLSRGAAIVAYAVVAAGFLLQFRAIQQLGIPSWDEAGHGLRGVTMWHWLRLGRLADFFDVFVAPDLYPPLGRFGMGLGTTFFGTGFDTVRVATAFASAAATCMTLHIAGRLVRPALRGFAMLAAAVFACTAWLPASTGRVALLESWSFLWTAAFALALGSAGRSGRTVPAFLAGLACAASWLTKYNYGLVALLGLGAWLGAGALLRRRSFLTLRQWSAFGLGCAPPLVWWFVYPWPSGGDGAAAHRASVANFFASSDAFEVLPASSLVALLPFAACGSLVAFGLASFGTLRGLLRLRDPLECICCILFFGGVAAFIQFPYRLDRFLVPTLFPLWAFGGATAAEAGCAMARRIVRADRRVAARASVAVAILFVIFAAHVATRGLGAWRAMRLAGQADRNPTVVLARRLQRWNDPYESSAPPASRPTFQEKLLEFAAETIDANRKFCWIGGNFTELNVACVRWKLYQTSGRGLALLEAAGGENDNLDSYADNAEGFRGWIDAYDQVVLVKPPRLEGFEALLGVQGFVASDDRYELKRVVQFVDDESNRRAALFYIKKPAK